MLRSPMWCNNEWLNSTVRSVFPQIPEDPWDERYIHLHLWFKFMVNVGEYTSPMDPMGIEMGGERGRLYLMQI